MTAPDDATLRAVLAEALAAEVLRLRAELDGYRERERDEWGRRSPHVKRLCDALGLWHGSSFDSMATAAEALVGGALPAPTTRAVSADSSVRPSVGQGAPFRGAGDAGRASPHAGAAEGAEGPLTPHSAHVRGVDP